MCFEDMVAINEGIYTEALQLELLQAYYIQGYFEPQTCASPIQMIRV